MVHNVSFPFFLGITMAHKSPEEERKEAGLVLVTITTEYCEGCIFQNDSDGCWDGPDCGDHDEILVEDTDA